MDLFKASQQWAKRPDDERFSSLDEMKNACKAYRDSSRIARVNIGDMRVKARGKEVMLTGRYGIPSRLSNWAFGQLCNRIHAPAQYLRQLPPAVASRNLNHGLSVLDKRGNGHADLLS